MISWYLDIFGEGFIVSYCSVPRSEMGIGLVPFEGGGILNASVMYSPGECILIYRYSKLTPMIHKTHSTWKNAIFVISTRRYFVSCYTQMASKKNLHCLILKDYEKVGYFPSVWVVWPCCFAGSTEPKGHRGDTKLTMGTCTKILVTLPQWFPTLQGTAGLGKFIGMVVVVRHIFSFSWTSPHTAPLGHVHVASFLWVRTMSLDF